VARDRACSETYEEEPGDLPLLGCVYATIAAANIPLLPLPPLLSLSLSLSLSPSSPIYPSALLSLSLSLSLSPPSRAVSTEKAPKWTCNSCYRHSRWKLARVARLYNAREHVRLMPVTDDGY